MADPKAKTPDAPPAQTPATTEAPKTKTFSLESKYLENQHITSLHSFLMQRIESIHLNIILHFD